MREAVQNAVGQYQMNPCVSIKEMTDFKTAIIRCGENSISRRTCLWLLFHLGQSVYQRLQKEGLQERCSNADDRYLKNFTCKLLRLAIVPVPDVLHSFSALRAARQASGRLWIRTTLICIRRSWNSKRNMIIPRFVYKSLH